MTRESPGPASLDVEPRGAIKSVMAKVVRISDLYKSVEAAKNGRSKWANGVQYLALSIIGNYADDEPGAAVDLQDLEATLLNGATNWEAYCYGGLLLISNLEIAERLCSPSELRRCTAKDGFLKDPNRREIWMDVQVRAAQQAWWLIRNCAAAINEFGLTSRYGVVEA